ncbi:MAG: PQQ-binding-like beta-propeller repeat protein [bacterium]|nr:PQQ-binding-like beta-propeller repeat protein [bacterium]
MTNSKLIGWSNYSKVRTVVVIVLVTVFLSACGGGLPDMHKLTGDIFKPDEKLLPGTREAVLKSRADIAPEQSTSKIAISIPAQKANANWTQPGGEANNAPGHLVFKGLLRSTWTSDAGAGSSSDGQLIPRPIVYNGRIYTMDTEGVVASFSASSGSVGFRVRLTPDSEEKEEGYGGGLAVDGGRLFAATGYGTIVALDPASGKALWTKVLGVPIRTSPTAFGGKVFVVTTQGRLYALSATDGEEVWSQRGLPDRTSILSNISPAIAGKTLVVPYSSGEISAYDLETGRPIWRDNLATGKSGSSLRSMANPGRPAIANDIVYAVGNSGRMIATSKRNGERIWSKTIASTQTPWPAGNMVYIVDRSGRVVALSSRGGSVVWVKQLTQGEQWLGPILAGDRLWLASNTGRIAGLNPKTGKIVSQRDLNYRIHIAPIVAAGHMYILTDNAKLIALN